MADPRHLELARGGGAHWNEWRRSERDTAPDLSQSLLVDADLAGADLSFTNLFAADLSGARLGGCDFNSANLMYTRLAGADLQGADFRQANLFAADLSRATVTEARFSGAHASGVKLREADLAGANLFVADITRADLVRARLAGSNFFGSLLAGSNLSGADCRGADFSGADLAGALMAGADLTGATLSDCKVRGLTAQDLTLDGAVQNDLVLTAANEPEITIDGLENALSLMALINAAAPAPASVCPDGAAVLLIGRWPHERRAFLNALREEARAAGYLPLCFDLEEAGDIDYSQLVTLLARLCCFALADLGGLADLPRELTALVTDDAVTVQPLVAGPAKPEVTEGLNRLAESASLRELFQTDDQATMLVALGPRVIAPLAGS